MRDTDNKDQTLQWVQTWKFAGAKLLSVRIQELEKYDYQANLVILNDMLTWACQRASSRPSSGLIEQQAYFRKLVKKLTGAK